MFINFISIIYQFYIKQIIKLLYNIIYIQFEETDLNTPNVFCN